VNLAPKPRTDARDSTQIVNEILARRLGYVPEWRPGNIADLRFAISKGADAALSWIAARFVYDVLQRLNQAPEKNKLAFLDLLGLSLTPAQASRAPIVFQLAEGASDSQAPVRTQVAAPPPPGSPDQIVFETERAVGVAAAHLTEVFTLWPGRDQYINHSNAFLVAEPFQLFKKLDLQDIPHAIYLAHNTLLAFAGSVKLEVELELTQTSSERLSILWHYWDGKVWRAFKYVRPACSEKEAANADSTGGFTASGSFLLEADCAESSKTGVNGIDGFWIRGQLTETLPPDPTRTLPEVDSVKISALVDQRLKARLTAVLVSDTPLASPGRNQIAGVLRNEAGEELGDIDVKITSPVDPNFPQVVVKTNTAADHVGEYDSTDALAARESYELEVAFLNLDASYIQRNVEPERNLGIDLTFNVDGLDPDKAFADGTKLDVTKPFYPFGQQPQPGSTFYFTQEEVFTKPGANLQIYVAKTFAPQDAVDISPAGDNPVKRSLPHLIAWEYWNGRKWITMFYSTFDPDNPTNPNPKDLTKTEIIEFTVPDDIEKTTVNEEEALWMRARVVSGGFGFKATVPTNAGGQDNQFTFVITQPPSIAAFRIGYSWRYGPFHPERALTFNDFQYEDHTFEATWPGRTFLPFSRTRDVTPALYLGFDNKLPVDSIGLFFDNAEDRQDTRGPAMVWEYFDGSAWQELSADDETQNLRLPGILSFIAAEDSQLLARFGNPLHWVRGRLKEDGPPGEPTVAGIFTNAVWASQYRTFGETPLGISTGLPNQVLVFTQIPVLSGERIEVQELSGARANVEWRILARELAPRDRNIIQDLEKLLSGEGIQTEFVRGDLRLVRDRNKKVIEAWVRWKEQPHFFNSKPEDRHYVIDRARGLVFFGDGVQGRIPPPSSPITSRQHTAGGGLVGNVESRAIKQMLAPIPGVQSVFNPRPAEGGADGEPIEAFSLRGPLSIRHRGRAISPLDYETLAYEASPAVARARAVPTRNSSGRPLPGWITLLLIPHSNEAHPLPSFGLREHVRRYIAERAPADIVGCDHLFVTGPNYLPIDVTVSLAPKDPAEAGAVEKRTRQAIEDFLHPLHGGPDGQGWDLGRDVYVSDFASVLERVEGLDYVRAVSILVDGCPQGEFIDVGDDRIVVAGEIRLRLEAAEE
jgi:Baseplate J-like protein